MAEPAVSKEQMESLENIARSLLTKLEHVEERLRALENAAPKAAAPPLAGAPAQVTAPAPAPVAVKPIAVDVESARKELFSRMWKYMNDESARTV